jgi:hypothetical protein
MNKRLLPFLIPFIAIIQSGMVQADTLSRQARLSVETLAKAFRVSQGDVVSKQGLAVLDIADSTPEASAHKIGAAVRARLDEAVQLSLVFFPVDREHTREILKEMELRMSGLASGESSAKFGELAGAVAMLTGDVTIAGENFRITLKLIGTEKGDVIATTSFEVPRSELIRTAREHQYEYVSKHGIGLTLNGVMPFYSSGLFNKSSLMFTDLTVNYRAQRWLLLGAGVMFPGETTGEQYRFEGKRIHKTFQPYLPTGVNTNIIPNQQTGKINVTFAHIDAQWTINISPSFNIGISGSLVVLPSNPKMTYEYGASGSGGGVYFRQRTANTNTGEFDEVPALDTKPLVYTFNTGVGARLEIRPEFFITPRLAIHAQAGYLFFSKLKLRQIDATYGSWSFYEQGMDSSTWEYDPASPNTSGNAGLSKQASEMYYGLNPTKKPDGGRFELDLSGFYASIGLSFYF